MTRRLAILCPGQGGQHAGMFDLLRADARAAQCIERWDLDAAIGIPLEQALTQEHLFSNAVAQPLIVAATLAAWEGIRPRLPHPSLVAGYSVGELSAYGVAGALDAQQAIGLARKRAQAMDECVRNTPEQALLAVAGVRIAQAQPLIAAREMFVAIDAGADSFIAGCLLERMPLIAEWIELAGGRVQRLPVAVASHTPLLQQASGAFEAVLRDADFAPLRSSVLSGISAEQVHDREKAITHLARQLSETIRWADCMDACAEAGIAVALELGPGAALSRMLRARYPHIACRSIQDFRSLEGAAAWVERALN